MGSVVLASTNLNLDITFWNLVSSKEVLNIKVKVKPIKAEKESEEIGTGIGIGIETEIGTGTEKEDENHQACVLISFENRKTFGLENLYKVI